MSTSAGTTAQPSAGSRPLLEVKNLTVVYQRRGSLFGKGRTIRAVNDVSFHIDDRETLGLVGESGSGKSTTGRAVLHLLKPASGSIVFDGVELTTARRRLPSELRRELQVVFQDPYSSLDPTKVVADLVGEPLQVHLGLRKKERDARVIEAIERVGLSPAHLERYPNEFSGGQRQRIAIARALITSPKLIVLDEPVSALDVSTQSQVVNLLDDLQAELGVSYLFIAHDLAVVRHASHRTAVLYLGRIVEDGPSDRVSEQPAHPYSQALLASVPVADPAAQRRRREVRRQLARGDIPSPTDLPPGCPFASRCSHVFEPCAEIMPVMTPVLGGGMVRCHLYDQTATDPQPIAAPLRREASAAADHF